MAASKRVRANREKLRADGADQGVHQADAAFDLIKSLAGAKFDETVDVAVRLSIDVRKSDQSVSGSTQLPHGLGREVKVAVIARGEQAQQATEAGAALVGYEDLVADIAKGKMDFDVLIATPDSMPMVGKLGRVLGPRGLMPNPKMGTVSADPAAAVQKAMSGQVQLRTEKKGGIVHCAVGKSSFESSQLRENLAAILRELQQLRPSTVKGSFIRKVTVSSTMGAGVTVDHASLLGS